MLKLEYFGHLMQRANSLEKILILGKTEGKKKGVTEDEMVKQHHPTMDMNLSQSRETVPDSGACCATVQSMGSEGRTALCD